MWRNKYISTTTYIKAVCVALLCAAQASVYSQGTVAPVIRHQLFDSTGVVCASCLLNAYTAGTTTRQDTFSDSALLTANANPIVLDSAGRAVIYLSQTTYRFILTTASGTTIWDQDNVDAIPTSAGNTDVTGTAGEALAAGSVVYLSDGTGSLTDGRWYLADSDNTYGSSAASMIGVVQAAIASAASGSIRLTGRITGLTGLTAGDGYYAGATAGALTNTPPTNARFIGTADSTTTLVVGGNPGAVRMPDSDGSHDLVFRTSTNLTADRTVTYTLADASLAMALPPALNINEGRCTLTTALPVTIADVTAATTLYYALYGGNRMTLYDGSNWNIVALSELSLTVPATTNTVYDVFVDYTAGTPALEAVAWTNDTTRATALALQNGVYVQTSDTDSKYVCSFRTTGVSGQTEDSFAKRYVWNYYNRMPRVMRVTEATDSWAYTTATIRQARATATNQLDFVIGVAEVAVEATVSVVVSNSSASVLVYVGIGEDSTSTFTTGFVGGFSETQVVGLLMELKAFRKSYPAVGRHFWSWNEQSEATGTTTWYGDNASQTDVQSGIVGMLMG